MARVRAPSNMGVVCYHGYTVRKLVPTVPAVMSSRVGGRKGSAGKKVDVSYSFTLIAGIAWAHGMT